MKSILRSSVLGLVLPALAQAAQENLQLARHDEAIEEIVVLGSRKGQFTEITEKAEKLVTMPGALGDPLGAITALPGVISPAKGGAPAVRGSSPSDNRYYIDGLPASYIFHDFNTSILDEHVIQDFQLFSAGFGAPYSNATGAVFDVRLRDPSRQKLATTINASLLRSGIFVEGLVTDNSAFYLSVRQGMLQYLLPKEDKPNDDGIRVESPPSDGDYQLKYLWDISSNDQITITMVGAYDGIEADIADIHEFAARNPDFAGRAKVDKGFATQGLRWQRSLDSGGMMQVALAQNNNANTVSWGDNYLFRTDFDNSIARLAITEPVGAHKITVGTEFNHYDYNYSIRMVNIVCTDFEPDCDSDRRGIVAGSRNLMVKHAMAFVSDNWQFNDALNFDLGLQYNSNNFTEEEFVHPRAALTWQFSPPVALTASAGQYDRFPDLETVFPLLGNPKLKSPKADHFTLGFKGGIGSVWNWSVEGYRKKLTQLPLALDSSQPDANLFYSNDVEGDASGVELMVNRELDNNWYGWMSLSYSQSQRTNARTQQTRDYTLDTPVVFNLVGNYKFNEQLSAGFRFSANSGQATTQITGMRDNPSFPGHYLPEYGPAYEERLPIYSRLDIRAERKTHFWGLPGSVYLDVVNALNQKNITGVDLDYGQVNKTGKFKLEKSREMGIFPSLGVEITF